MDTVSLKGQVVDTVSLKGEGVALADQGDRILMVAAALHDQTAFSELYLRHAGSVTAAARMVLGDGPASEDVTNDVFMALWKAPEKFDPERGSLLSFLRMKAKSRSIDILRAESSRRRREEIDQRGERDPASGTEATAMAATDTAFLRQTISGLPDNEREPIAMAFFHGMAYKAIAVQLRLPEGTVKSRIRSGLRRLRLTESVQMYRAALQAVD